jgi:Ni,Fe-hydrogenase I large subunit
VTQIVVDPFNRVEGDLAVEAHLSAGQVVEALLKGTMFRGFEHIMVGQRPIDALVLCCRICGICSCSHSTAGSAALRAAMGAEMPPNAYLVRNIVLGTEILMSHLTHFYFLYLPDFINQKYRAYPHYQELVERFRPFSGSSYRRALKARRSPLEIMGLFAGKWPNTLALQPGGVTSCLDISHLTRGLGILREFRDFIETNFLGCELAKWFGVRSAADLEAWRGEPQQARSDLGLILGCLQELGIGALGKGCGRFLSFGAYELPEGGHWLRPGYWADSESFPLDLEAITEETAFSYYEGNGSGRHPQEGLTEPAPDKQGAYSWAKAPRYFGQPVEVGPLARLLVEGEPLVSDLVRQRGPSVFARTLARVHEMLMLLAKLEEWMKRIDPREPFYLRPRGYYGRRGVGLAEAARGSLGHWISIAEGRVANYQVVAPTAWNASPRDGQGTPGPIEQALCGVGVEEAANPVELSHIVRSFDPCLSCTVHALKVR